MHKVSKVRIREKGTVKSLIEIISPILKESGLEEGMRLDIIRSKWDNLLREPLSIHLNPVSLRDGELLMSVDSPLWLQEVTLRKEEILKVLKPFNIRDIRFRLGRTGFRTHKDRSVKGHNKQPGKGLSPQSLRFIDEAVGAVEDEDLRKAIRAAIEKSLSSPEGSRL